MQVKPPVSHKKILVVVAHPDDAEAFCGGTIARLTRAANLMTLVMCTNGDRGSHDHRLRPTELVSMRRQEEEVCRILGLVSVIWLGYRDGELSHMTDLRERIIRVIRKSQTDIILTFDPWKHYEFHPDHRSVGFIASEARMLSDLPWICPEFSLEGLAPWHTQELYLFAPEEPNYWVDISDTLEAKINSRLAHHSQNDFIKCDSDRQSFASQLKAWARSAGTAQGLEYAEAFHTVDQIELWI
jgi:LmbE family N-acetylglucosaminyl deacetylase